MHRAVRFLISLALPFAAGLVGSAATAPAIPTWYADVIKPSFSPPNWVFGPVWTALYILMGVALYRIWSRQPARPLDVRRQQQAVTLFIVHLALNAGWSVVFFGLHSPLLGLMVIIALLAMIIAIIKKFYALDRLAAYLLLPYLAWVAFATLLNAAIWWLN